MDKHMHETHGLILYQEIQKTLKKYHDIAAILRKWEKERIFDSKLMNDLIVSIKTFHIVDDLLGSMLANVT
jgi:uncharacterized protein HemY